MKNLKVSHNKSNTVKLHNYQVGHKTRNEHTHQRTDKLDAKISFSMW